MATALTLEELGRADGMERVHAVEQGLPVSLIRSLVREGFSLGELARVIAPRRTLERRLKGGGRLTTDESDRLSRLQQVYELALDTFEDPAETIDWLRSPLRAFDENAPLDLVKTSAGAQEVKDLLQRAFHGMLA